MTCRPQGCGARGLPSGHRLVQRPDSCREGSKADVVTRFPGGAAAFEALTERYGKSVYTSCSAVLVDAERAADLTERAFASAARKLRRSAVTVRRSKSYRCWSVGLVLVEEPGASTLG